MGSAWDNGSRTDRLRTWSLYRNPSSARLDRLYLQFKMADDLDFNQGDSGASETYPMQCSALRKGGFVMIKNRPCKIVEMSTSKTGKHGHAKVHMVALDIFTGKKLEDICPSTHNMNVPNVTRKDYVFSMIDDDGYVTLMEDDGEQKEDLKVPDDDVGVEMR